MRLTFCVISIAAFGLGAVAPCWANASDAPASDIIVTAQLREERAGEIGMSLDVVQGDDLQARGVSAAPDLDKIAPGLTVTHGAATGIPVFTIRGAGFVDFSAAASSTVGLYHDDVAMPYALMARGLLFDLARIEALKGPQGDLYGRNATAGHIRFISNLPTRSFSAGAQAEFNNFGQRDLEGFISGAIGSLEGADVQGRLAGRFVRSDKGWQKSVTKPSDRLGARDEAALRATVLIDAPAASVTLRAYWDQDKSENFAPAAYDGREGGFSSAQPRPTLFDAGQFFNSGDNRLADWSEDFRPKRDNTIKGASAKADWSFGRGLNLVAITAFDDFERDEKVEGSGVRFEDGRWRLRTDGRSFSQELRLSSDPAQDFHWLAGLYYAQDTLDETVDYFLSDSFFGFALGINDVSTRFAQKAKSAAGFGHAEWRLAEPLTLTLGARYTEEQKKWRSCTYDSGDGSLAGAWNFILTPFFLLPNGLPDPGPAQAGGCAVYNDIPGTADYGRFAVFTDKISSGDWTWKSALSYRPNANALAFLSIARGVKFGGFNGTSQQTFSQIRPYGAERLTALETGLKAALFERALSLNLAAFYNDYRDKQETTLAVTPVGNIPSLTNIPKSQTYGAEIDVQWRRQAAWSVFLKAAYLQTKILKYEAIDPVRSIFPDVVTFDAAGYQLPNAPHWRANAGGQYQWRAPKDMRIILDGELSYKSKSFGTADQRNRISDYWLVNARLSLMSPDERYTIAAWARNLFNKDYWTAAFVSNGLYARNMGEPATYGLTIRARYGG